MGLVRKVEVPADLGADPESRNRVKRVIGLGVRPEPRKRAEEGLETGIETAQLQRQGRDGARESLVPREGWRE